jgi:hypothetical protein
VVTDTGVPNVAGNNFRQADFAIAPTDLPSGAYFLQLREGPINSASDGTSTFWAFSSLQQGSLARLAFNPTNPTFNAMAGSDFAFQVFGSSQSSAAPEPGALTLLGAGLGIAGLVIRRRH